MPEPRQLLITPFDRNALGAIEKGLLKSDVGITPNNDGNNIRLNIPQLNEQRRKELIKQVHQKAETGRVSVRNVRHDAVKKLQTQKKDKENPDLGKRREARFRTGPEARRQVHRWRSTISPRLKKPS